MSLHRLFQSRSFMTPIVSSANPTVVRLTRLVQTDQQLAGRVVTASDLRGVIARNQTVKALRGVVSHIDESEGSAA